MTVPPHRTIGGRTLSMQPQLTRSGLALRPETSYGANARKPGAALIVLPVESGATLSVWPLPSRQAALLLCAAPEFGRVRVFFRRAIPISGRLPERCPVAFLS